MDESDSIFAGLRKLSDIEAIAGVVVFGSLARDELTDASDIDVLIIHEDAKDFKRLRAAIKSHIATDPNLRKFGPIRPVFYSPDALLHEIEERPSFAAHLADEGVVLHRTAAVKVVERALAARPPTQRALRKELAARLSKLRLFADPRRFNGEFISCLAQLYSISRAVVIVKLLENNVREYSWRKVFDTYSSLRPELREDLKRLAALRAFYEHARNRSELPKSWHNVDSQYVDDTISAITTVAAS